MEGVFSHQIPHLSFYIICRYVQHERYSILSPYGLKYWQKKVLSLKSYNMKYANSNLTGLARFSTSPQLRKTFTGTTSSLGLFPKKNGRGPGDEVVSGSH